MGTIAVAWWNLQNHFDIDADSISQDFEFTKDKGWTEEVYAAKRANLAAVLNQLHQGSGPELLGVAEVEDDDVFAQLLAESTSSGESFANRYQVLDRLVVSRGLLLPGWGHTGSCHGENLRGSQCGNPHRRPRSFNKKTKKGTSDHLPMTALLTY